MYKKIVLVIAILFLSISAFSQASSSINDYKYLILPLQYDFVKGKNKYRLNTYTRFLFKQEGYLVYFDEEELPKDLFNNRCLALYGDVVSERSMLATKLKIELKDCYGNLVYMSNVGKSKFKAYDKAYADAIKKAFESVKFLNYKYDASSENAMKLAKTIPQSSNSNTSEADRDASNAEVERLKKEVEDLKLQKELAEVKSEKERLEKEKEKIAEKLKKETQTKIVTKSEIKESKKEAEIKSDASKDSKDLLYAQPTETGFQLVDVSPKVVMVLIKTAAPNVFTVKGKDAIVFKEGDKWMYSENSSKKQLNIKF